MQPPKRNAIRFSLSFTVPVAVKSEMNARDHWAVRRKRFDTQKDAVAVSLVALWLNEWNVPLPVVVTLTRFYSGRPMDDDNLAGAFKAVRDYIADWLGTDDGNRNKVEWKYDQRKGGVGFEVRIEGER